LLEQTPTKANGRCMEFAPAAKWIYLMLFSVLNQS